VLLVNTDDNIASKVSWAYNIISIRLKISVVRIPRLPIVAVLLLVLNFVLAVAIE
jgi:hypothetical protein